MEKKIFLVFLLTLIMTTVIADHHSHNHMNGPGNVIISGTGNSANGRDNTFEGNNNHAEGNENSF